MVKYLYTMLTMLKINATDKLFLTKLWTMTTYFIISTAFDFIFGLKGCVLGGNLYIMYMKYMKKCVQNIFNYK